MHGGPRLSRPVAVVLVLVAAVGLGLGLTGCSSRVAVAVPAAAVDPACATAGARWPGSVSGHDRVEIDITWADTATPAPDSGPAPQTVAAAWGSPAIVARCGLGAPGPSTAECVSVDGVDWLVRPLSDGSAFTTYGRSPAIEVMVPAAYGPGPLLLPVFGEAARALPTTGRHCA